MHPSENKVFVTSISMWEAGFIILFHTAAEDGCKISYPLINYNILGDVRFSQH
jgi:hypothetical protein